MMTLRSIWFYPSEVYLRLTAACVEGGWCSSETETAFLATTLRLVPIAARFVFLGVMTKPAKSFRREHKAKLRGGWF
jgi:hypothetical protein